MRVNRGQEFVIGGYTVGTKTFDALVFGYYEGDRLIYAARTRNGFTPVVREQLFKKFRGLEIKDCPFVNLPEAKSGRWGAGLTAAKMKDCRWLKPVLVAQIEFLEWTGENTYGIPSSLLCAKTNRHAMFDASRIGRFRIRHPQGSVLGKPIGRDSNKASARRVQRCDHWVTARIRMPGGVSVRRVCRKQSVRPHS
jgi:hypothetical protein